MRDGEHRSPLEKYRTESDRDRLLRGGNGGNIHDPNPENRRRDLIVLAALIDHPQAGLLLFETGCAEDVDVVSENHFVKEKDFNTI
jgi:hypothetical protein